MSRSLTPGLRSLVWLAVIVAGTSLEYVPAALATRETKAFCSDLASGTSLEDVRARATSKKFSASPVREGTWLIEHRWSIGRAYCVARFDRDGRLSSMRLGD